MKSWIISIISVVLLNLVSEIILSQSTIGEFIKKIFGLVTILVIISPIANIFKIDIDNIINTYDSKFNYQSEYISIVENGQEEFYENYIKQLLEDEGFLNVNVEIDYKIEDNGININKITLNLKNLVINENQPHINKYTEIKNIICNAIPIIEESDILINE